tara:strand:+ start:3207 stop:3815 length:609 start_codon:yes stop_codon:yes gene_type:complete
MAKISAQDWLKIWNADQVYFDSKRAYGYGGYHYDGRWKEIVKILKEKFNLNKKSSLLDLGCAKGFLVNDFNLNHNVGQAKGIDISLYALLEGASLNMKGDLICSNFTDLPFEDNDFSLVFSKDSLHNILSKKEVIDSLREIERVGKNSWIRVGAYENKRQKEIIDKWAVFATTYLHKNDWLELFEISGFSGNYDWFHPSEKI